MAIELPAFFGVILLKSKITKPFIEREIAFLSRLARDKEVLLNEDSNLIAFSVAMNEADLDATIMNLKEMGAEEGVNFVTTSHPKGLLAKRPKWLRVESGEEISTTYHYIENMT